MKTQRLCSLLTAAGVLLASVPFAPRLLPESTLTAYAADEGYFGQNLYYTLDDEGTLTITGTGAMKDGSNKFSENPDIRSIVISEGVTSIGDNVFEKCNELTSVTIPDTVTSIGERAFYECGSLSEINIPDAVTTIGAYAFWNCINLSALHCHDSGRYCKHRARRIQIYAVV